MILLLWKCSQVGPAGTTAVLHDELRLVLTSTRMRMRLEQVSCRHVFRRFAFRKNMGDEFVSGSLLHCLRRARWDNKALFFPRAEMNLGASYSTMRGTIQVPRKQGWICDKAGVNLSTPSLPKQQERFWKTRGKSWHSKLPSSLLQPTHLETNKSATYIELGSHLDDVLGALQSVDANTYRGGLLIFFACDECM